MSSLPTTLVRFRSELEHAIARERSRRRRRLVARAALAGAASTAVALGILSALPSSRPSDVERAAAALGVNENTILHTKWVMRWVPSDGRVQMITTEAWDERRAPGAHREIVQSDLPNLPGLEGGRVVGDRRLYRTETALSSPFVTPGPYDRPTNRWPTLFDPATNTIYEPGPQTARPAPAMCEIEGAATRTQLHTCEWPYFAPGPRPGTVRLTSLRRLNDTKPFRWEVRHEVVDQTEADALRRQIFPAEPSDEWNSLRIQELLQSGEARVRAHVDLHGRDAIPLTWNGGHSVYLVDARTYDPIELRETSKRGTRTTTFLVYERLPLNDATRPLLSVERQHPTAVVVDDPRAYAAAMARLSPHG